MSGGGLGWLYYCGGFDDFERGFNVVEGFGKIVFIAFDSSHAVEGESFPAAVTSCPP